VLVVELGLLVSDVSDVLNELPEEVLHQVEHT